MRGQPPVRCKGSAFQGVHCLLWNHPKEVSGKHPKSGAKACRSVGKEVFRTATCPPRGWASSPRLRPGASSLPYLDSLPVTPPTASWLMHQPHADNSRFPSTDLLPDIHTEISYCLLEISIWKSNKALKFHTSKTKTVLVSQLSKKKK